MLLHYYNRFWELLCSPSFLRFAAIVIGSVLLGFVLTFPGLHQWDEEYAMRHSNWVLQQYNLYSGDYVLLKDVPEWKATQYYGPVWELMLGIGTQFVFPFLHDPIWVRHALNFALFPLSAISLYWLLRIMRLTRSTSLLLTSAPFAVVRLGGHSLFNTRDAPAALAFLIVTIGLWVLFHALQQCTSRYSILIRVTAIASVAIIPALLRMPLFLHLCLSVGMLATLYWGSHPPPVSRWQMVALTLTAAGILTYVMYPPAWTTSPDELWNILYTLFSYNLHWDYTPLFGHYYPSDNLPWWYSIFWLPIITHPLLLVCSAYGTVALVFPQETLGKPLQLRFRNYSIRVSFQRWIWLCVGSSWTIVLLLKPELYDAERQVLFLYPMLLFFGLTGLHVLRNRTKYLLASVIIVSSVSAYVGWGRYSYIYTSPFFPGLISNMQGDYWGLCMPQAINQLTHLIPMGTYIRFSEPFVTGALQRDRLINQHSWTYDPQFNYPMGESTPSEEQPHATIFNNSYRSRIRDIAIIDIENNKAEVRWQAHLPTGEEVCTLVYYSAQGTIEEETGEISVQ